MQKLKLVRLALALAVPAVGAVILSNTATANVRNVSPASSCQWADEDARHGHHIDSAGDITFQSKYGTGSMYHTYSDRLLADCPVNRNLPLSTAGLSDLEIRFRSAFDTNEEPSGKREFRCVAYSIRPDGSFLNLQIRLGSVVALPPPNSTNTPQPIPAGAYATLDFGNSINQSVSKGSYGAFCDFPGMVIMESVYASEVDGIDGN